MIALEFNTPRQFLWARKHKEGYEVSSKGDKRFSAFYAKMPDGRTIEQHYQCDVKGYDIGGTNWKLGKGKPPKIEIEPKMLYIAYLTLWETWSESNNELLQELYDKAINSQVLTDCFATTEINQAHALCDILNYYQGLNFHP